ncbi:MAG: fimbrillin family protein [Alistipes sp.]|nr:fimbrillin family protein [Alistipes sp.]
MRKNFKLTLVALSLLALTACSAEHEINIPAPQGDEISFGTVNTRAGLSDLERDGFGVWAYVSNSTTQNYPLMDNQFVKHEDGSWVYSPVKYWLDNTVFTFIGVYPYAEESPYFSSDAANSAVELTVSETPSDVDFLIATNEIDTNNEYDPVVSMQFRHVLTSVSLNIWRDGAKHQNDQMRIKKVTLGNIRKGGTYSTATSLWTYNESKLTAEMENTNLTDSDNIGAATMVNGSLETGGTPASPFGTMMLLPQTIDESNIIALRIEYEIKRNNAADWESAELEASIPNATWLAGNRYTYNVVLSSVTDITFYYIQTKVDPWGTPQVGGTVIIK